MIKNCLTCKLHGPPLTTYENHEPCKRCVTEPGFPMWEDPGDFATGYTSPTGADNAKTEPEPAT